MTSCLGWQVANIAKVFAVIAMTTWPLAAMAVAQETGSDDAERIPTKTIIVVSTLPEATVESATSGQAVAYGLTRRDYGAIREIPTCVSCVPFRFHHAATGREDEFRIVCGTTPEWASERGIELERGRFLTDADASARSNVAVISAELAGREFPLADPIGKELVLNDSRWTIVGVTKPRASEREEDREREEVGDADREPDATPISEQLSKLHQPTQSVDVYLPITSMAARWGDQQMIRTDGSFQVFSCELSGVLLRVERLDQRERTVELIRTLIEQHHSAIADVIVDSAK